MPVDVENTSYIPKRFRRGEWPVGRKGKVSAGRAYQQVPDALVDSMDAGDDGRPGKSYIVSSSLIAGLTAKWSDIADGGAIDGATDFAAGENADPMTFAFTITWLATASGLLLQLGNATTGGVSLGLLQSPLRLVAVVGTSDADKVELIRRVDPVTSQLLVLSFAPVANVEPKLKVWVGQDEVLSAFHDYAVWQGAFDDDGGYHAAGVDQLDLDAPNAIGSTAAANVTIASNLAYYDDQLPDAF